MKTTIAGFALLASMASQAYAASAPIELQQPSSAGAVRPDAGTGSRPAPASCAKGSACERKLDYNNDAGTPDGVPGGLY